MPCSPRRRGRDDFARHPARPADANRSPAAQPFGTRIVVGLLGVLLASLTAGLNGHVTEIAMTDVRGALAIGHDEGTWLTVLCKPPRSPPWHSRPGVR